jgi:hypothetical protein
MPTFLTLYGIPRDDPPAAGQPCYFRDPPGAWRPIHGDRV